jgi:hypothetical protein
MLSRGSRPHSLSGENAVDEPCAMLQYGSMRAWSMSNHPTQSRQFRLIMALFDVVSTTDRIYMNGSPPLAVGPKVPVTTA